MLRRLLEVAVTPKKWGKVWPRVRILAHNVTHYGHFSLNPNTKAYWDQRLAKFGDRWRDENYFLVLDLFPKDESFTLLDIGCALGDGCELLQGAFPNAQIFGSDISETGIQKAKSRRSSVHYFVLDILTQPIADTYDYVLIVETLEHFDNPYPVVDKCLKHVRKSLIVTVPYDQRLGNTRFEMSEHRRRFDENTFANYNCRVVRVTDHVEVTNERCIIYEIKP